MMARTCEIVIRGELDDRFAYLFEGMTLTRGAGTTVLTGEVVDQSMLLGLLERIESIGLALLEIREVADTETPDAEGRGQ
jgi:hypothetical protein